MGDLAKEENRAAEKLHEGAGHELQTRLFVFKLAKGSCLLFLFCYMNSGLLTVMAILVCCVTILKLAYHEQNDAGHQVDHSAQHIPQVPKQENVDQHNLDHNAPPEIPEEDEHEHKNHTHGQQTHEIEEDHLVKHNRESTSQSQGRPLQVHTLYLPPQNKKHRKKRNKNKKVDSIAEGILEGLLDGTTVMVDIATGGILSPFYSIFRQ